MTRTTCCWKSESTSYSIANGPHGRNKAAVIYVSQTSVGQCFCLDGLIAKTKSPPAHTHTPTHKKDPPLARRRQKTFSTQGGAGHSSGQALESSLEE